MQYKSSDIFQCKKCGDCCRGFGGTYVTRDDIKAISKYVRADESRFDAEFCQKSGKRNVLAQGENGYCVFWDQVCSIHPVKPKMCRAWPFIESVLKDVENWRIMAGSCPGMSKDADDEAIIACVKEEIRLREKGRV